MIPFGIASLYATGFFTSVTDPMPRLATPRVMSQLAHQGAIDRRGEGVAPTAPVPELG